MPFVKKVNFKVKHDTILDFWNALEDNLPRKGVAYGPMERLMQYMRENKDVIVVTRGMREVRAILTGKLGGFDRFWNLVLFEVTEILPTEFPSLRSQKGPGRKRRKRQRRNRKAEKERLEKREKGDVAEKPTHDSDTAELMADDSIAGEMEVSTPVEHVNPEPMEEPTSSEVRTVEERRIQEIDTSLQTVEISSKTMEHSKTPPKTVKEVGTQGSDLRGYESLALQPREVFYPALYVRGANVVYVTLKEMQE